MEVLICLLFVAYLFPFAVAARHEHPRLGAVLALNFLLGWTGVGWWLALYWARRPAAAPEPVVVRRQGHLRLLETPAGRDVRVPARGPRPARRRPARVRQRETR